MTSYKNTSDISLAGNAVSSTLNKPILSLCASLASEGREITPYKSPVPINLQVQRGIRSQLVQKDCERDGKGVGGGEMLKMSR